MNEFKNLYTRHLTRIEQLARRLLQQQYESAQDLWTIQTDLVRYQIEVRAEIRATQSEKSETQNVIADVAARRESDWKNKLRSLQANIKSAEIRESILDHALSLSKQFGDAFAWIFLKGHVHRIRALAINKPNPPVPDGLSLEAMLGVAKSFANVGAGFPLIHDVTSILRVGDLTFCNVLDDDDEPLTVEVKSKLQKVDGDIATLDVAIYAPAVQPKFATVLEKLRQTPVEPVSKTEAAAESPARLLGGGPRLERQVARMARARKLQAATHLATIDQAGNNILAALSLRIKASYFHWDVIKGLAVEAKEQGYATRAVDGAFFYTLTYTENGSIYPWSASADLPFAAELAERLKESFPFCGVEERDHICFRSSWDYLSGKMPPYIRPFFLYNLPDDFIFDLMWRRLSIVVYLNIGKMVEALQGAGIDARLPANDEELNHQFIPVTYEKIDGESMVRTSGGDLNEFANKVGFEFMSLDGFVSCVRQTVDAAIELTKGKTADLKRVLSC